MNPATNWLTGLSYNWRGVSHLLQVPAGQHRHPVTHGHRFHLVVGDVHGGDAETALQFGDLAAGLHAQLGIQVGQRLVHQEDPGLAHDGAAHGDPLPLAPGQRLGLAVEHLVVQVEQAGGLADPPGSLLLGHALHLEREAHVLGDGLTRVQGIVLEDHRDVPVLGRDEGDILLADLDAPAVQGLEAGQHAQRGGLA